MYSSHNSHDPIMAPTPAPIVVNTALPVAAPAPSSNSYNFDPSGLTPAQQLAYAQMQLQHQQQHLKKMRQRLPHGKSGSPLLLRRDNAHIPSGALIGGSTLGLVGTPDTISETGSMK